MVEVVEEILIQKFRVIEASTKSFNFTTVNAGIVTNFDAVSNINAR